MSDPSKRFGGAGIFFHLFVFGLVFAGSAILFGLASFSLFGISRETPLRARIGRSMTEFICPRSAVAPYAEEHAPIKIDLSSLPDATPPLARSAKNPTTSDMLSQEPGPESDFVLLPDHEASAATQETSRAPAIQGPVSNRTLPAELSASQQAITDAAPPADAAAPIVEEERNGLPMVSGIRNYRPTTLDQASGDAHETTSAEQPPPRASSYYRLPNPKAVFRYRLRKECGELSPNFGDGLKDQAAAWA